MTDTTESTSQRLDHYLSRLHPEISRGYLQKLIDGGEVLVNKVQQKASYKLKKNDNVKVLTDFSKLGKVPELDLPIIYEDKNVLVIDKPAGILSHALSKFHNEASVASFLRQKLGGKSGDIRFGIVHRLDRATSGVMICAKNHPTMSFLQKQFSAHKVEKTYLAIVLGQPKLSEGLIDVPLERNPKMPAQFRPGSAGKSAQTIYKVIQTNDKYSLLELKPKTGRTHQLRVHMKHIGHSIVGDVLYSGETADRLYLHAWKLSISLPEEGRADFEAPIPKEFTNYIELP